MLRHTSPTYSRLAKLLLVTLPVVRLSLVLLLLRYHRSPEEQNNGFIQRSLVVFLRHCQAMLHSQPSLSWQRLTEQSQSWYLFFTQPSTPNQALELLSLAETTFHQWRANAQPHFWSRNYHIDTLEDVVMQFIHQDHSHDNDSHNFHLWLILAVMQNLQFSATESRPAGKLSDVASFRDVPALPQQWVTWQTDGQPYLISSASETSIPELAKLMVALDSRSSLANQLLPMVALLFSPEMALLTAGLKPEDGVKSVPARTIALSQLLNFEFPASCLEPLLPLYRQLTERLNTALAKIPYSAPNTASGIPLSTAIPLYIKQELQYIELSTTQCEQLISALRNDTIATLPEELQQSIAPITTALQNPIEVFAFLSTEIIEGQTYYSCNRENYAYIHNNLTAVRELILTTVLSTLQEQLNSLQNHATLSPSRSTS